MSETAKHNTPTEENRSPEPDTAALLARDESAFLADPLAGLTDAEVRRLKRADLLEILVAQGDEIACLRAENDRLRQSAAASQAGSRQLSELLGLVRSLDSRQQEQEAMLRGILQNTQSQSSSALTIATTEAVSSSATPSKSNQSSQPKPSAAGLARKLFSAASHSNS